ncbi:MAG: His/Gly/Thr/Pro-type tRNA ligase C-terminal domain-containing protein, partial [Alphaproteobacteria bacterium]|nr:His/Gly/Thr/Pro-type tRNA ligase C-terminal domain-containing protein [Alphaproteobacteria bacterium]
KLNQLTAFGEPIRVKVDDSLKATPDKFWSWTKKGAPFIFEVGPRDVDGNNVMVRHRLKLGTKEGKEILSLDALLETLPSMIEKIQEDLYLEAKTRFDENIRTDIDTPEAFKAYFENNNVFLEEAKTPVGFVRAKWSEDEATIEMMKEMKISIRAIPFDQSGTEGICPLTGKKATLDVIYARSY